MSGSDGSIGYSFFSEKFLSLIAIGDEVEPEEGDEPSPSSSGDEDRGGELELEDEEVETRGRRL